MILTRSPEFRVLPTYGAIPGHLRVYQYFAWLKWVWVWG